MLKSDTIYNWKKRGLIGNYDEIYDKYISTTHCELCNVILTDGKPIRSNTKEMNHNHLTGYFINIICHYCNSKNDRQLIRNRKVGKTGHKYILYRKERNTWIYVRQSHYKCKKHFKNKIDALCYKYIHLLKIFSQERKKSLLLI
jgi:hypothetical protein